MTKVIESFHLAKKVGEVGIEIEVESLEHPVPNVENRYWHTVMDGSLRGYSAEYVLKNPVKRKEITKVLNNLSKEWASSQQRANFGNSHRTSTHIHINMQENSWNEVISFFVLYMIFEDLFVRFCGREREGNLFCLRGRDAEYMIEQVLSISSRGMWNSFLDNNIRYASLNMASLGKFGSMEFRAMRGTTDMATIRLWINMLLQLKDHALEYDNPRNILELFSQTGEAKFLEEIMGDYAEVLQCPQMRRMIREGVWRIQELAYTPIKDIKRAKRQPRMRRAHSATSAQAAMVDFAAPPGNTPETLNFDDWEQTMRRLGLSEAQIQRGIDEEATPSDGARRLLREEVERDLGAASPDGSLRFTNTGLPPQPTFRTMSNTIIATGSTSPDDSDEGEDE